MSSSDTRPTRRSVPFVVGVGASAGGLEALNSFFGSVPSDSGIAFVVIQHLSPDYKSMLVGLLNKVAQIPVLPAEDGQKLEADHVYVIEPRTDIRVQDMSLVVSQYDPGTVRGLHLPIDIFLESLARDRREECAAIILSGTGSDGARGGRLVKELGGLVLAQDIDTARFDGMPRAASATGAVDMLLPPQEMPRYLIRAAREGIPQVDFNRDPDSRTPLQTIFHRLRTQSGVDFTHYKTNTLLRRMERRMGLHGIDSLFNYAELLKDNPTETSALYREILIGVTRFFRDQEAVALIEEQISRLITDETQPVRVWVAACSTGEEAYTLAILISEALRRAGSSRSFRIFATDIDQDALLVAGRGWYPIGISADIPEPLLRRYFELEGDGYRIRAELRERLIFSRHNLLSDPPFARLDMVSCRNLLIYLKPQLQTRVLGLFSFALRKDGLLWLGPSETLGEQQENWQVESVRWRIFRSQGRQLQGIPLETSVSSSGPAGVAPLPKSVRPTRRNTVLNDIHASLLSEHCPPLLVLNAGLELVFSFGDLSALLQTADGLMSLDARNMLPSELSLMLPSIVSRLKDQPGQTLRYTNLEFTRDNKPGKIQFRARQIRSNTQWMFVLLFDSLHISHDQPVQVPENQVQADLWHRIEELEEQLLVNQERLQATIEELESSNEELQATNEEMLSANEELQSTNEELHSVNEELHTVNAEYQLKIGELSDLNRDLGSLLESLDVGVLLLDQTYLVQRHNEMAASYLPIVSSNVDQPLSSLRGGPVLDGVLRVSRSVFQDHESVQETLQGPGGHVLRLVGSPIGDKVIEGVVLTIHNTGEQSRIKERLTILEAAFAASETPTVVLDTDHTIVQANAAFATAYEQEARWLPGASLKEVVARFQPPSDLSEPWWGVESREDAAVLVRYLRIDRENMPPMLLRTEARLSLQLEDGVVPWVYSPETQRIYVSPELARQHGMTDHGVLPATRLAATLHPEERSGFLAALRSPPISLEVRISLADGGTRHARLSGLHFSHAGQDWLVGTSTLLNRPA